MMRNKVITFCAAMGIPISSWGSTFGCTGICGSCQLSCLPGAAAVVILSVKIFSKKIAEKTAWEKNTSGVGCCYGNDLTQQFQNAE